MALDERLGLPVDSYVNGSQTWLVEESGVTGGDPPPTFEWRLHPVAGYHAPDGMSHYDLWEQVVAQLSTGASPDALELGGVMAVAPLGADPAPAFASLMRVAEKVRTVEPAATWVSAGMSGDLEAAVAAGATHVRIGSAILGPRPALG